MNIYKSFDEIPYVKNTILTVGTFDGVHLGHRIIIEKLLSYSKNQNLRNLILTFDPHPQIVLKKKNKPELKLLSTIEERLELFERFGIENVLIIPFSKEFSKTSPEEFIVKYLNEKVGFSKILIGYDHLFGKNREGSIELLNKYCDELNFDIEKLSALRSENSNEDIIISSTKIRNALSEKNLSLANEYLGYNYFLKGKVTHGDKRGRTIGYPTANVSTQDPNKFIPAKGVYLVSTIIGDKKYFGMANLGNRPTFVDSKQTILEVNIFDFKEDIYDKIINVEFIEYIREERKFENREEIIRQLVLDEEKCRHMLK